MDEAPCGPASGPAVVCGRSAWHQPFTALPAVQLAFRRHLDTTPIEYLRRVRLDRAHHDLIAADPARVTVTAIAVRWGFPSPSRFAARYRQAYGISPSHTLHS